MAENSKIQWCDHTANLWHGCTKVSAGCDNCYAETQSIRWGKNLWGNDKPRLEIKSVWNDLLRFQKLAKEKGQMHSVFVGSMMDIFEKPMPLIDSKGNALEETTGDLRNYFFKNIVTTPNLLFLLLTKRPSNINKYIPTSWKANPPPNVMFGTSPVDQQTADTLIPQLLEVKGLKFLSIEPQLSKVDFTSIRNRNREGVVNSFYQVLKPITGCGDADRDAIDWVICGGESGHHRRPFNLDWARKLRNDCQQANVPFFFKQIDKVTEKKTGIPMDLKIRQFPQILNRADGAFE